MEFRQLTYFLAAAQTQNFRKAADLCLVAQPALSRQIASLEDELGVALFKRVKQRVILTPAGREFASYARGSLEVLQQGQQAMVRLREGESGTVLIACNKSLAALFLPTILASFHQQYPQIHHKVSVLHTDEVIALVEQGEVDLGLIFNPVIRSEVVIVKELFRQPLHVLVSAQHTLAQVETPLTLEQIVAEPLFLLGETARLRIVLERIFAQRGISVQPAIEIDSIEGLKAIVRQGNGITLMPPALLRFPQVDDGLALLPLADLTEEFIFALVYRRFGTISQSARQLIHALVEKHTSEGEFVSPREHE